MEWSRARNPGADFSDFSVFQAKQVANKALPAIVIFLINTLKAAFQSAGIVNEAAKAKPLPAATEYPDTTDDNDPLYEKAVAIVIKEKRASISLVQRHLLIGYNHAARLIESMEENGLVSVPNSAGHREVIQQ